MSRLGVETSFLGEEFREPAGCGQGCVHVLRLCLPTGPWQVRKAFRKGMPWRWCPSEPSWGVSLCNSSFTFYLCSPGAWPDTLWDPVWKCYKVWKSFYCIGLKTASVFQMAFSIATLTPQIQLCHAAIINSNLQLWPRGYTWQWQPSQGARNPFPSWRYIIPRKIICLRKKHTLVGFVVCITQEWF